MILGALLDAGLAPDDLREILAQIELSGFHLRISRERRGALVGTRCQVEVETPGTHDHRHLAEIQKLVEQSGLDPVVKTNSLAVFHRLAQAEAAVHDVPLEQIHFHEVGAVDAILDVVGSVGGLALLGVDAVYASPLPLGQGMVRCAHGTLPVPAPATVRLLTGVPVYDPGIKRELVTPTGAAILTTLATGFGPAPAMTLKTSGYGVGTHPSEDPPNLLRILLGESAASAPRERLLMVESNIDDMNPEFYDYLMERLFALGALDVGLISMQMKKNRPGVLLRILLEPHQRDPILACLFAETTTLGARFQEVERITLPREAATVVTPFGPMRIKRAHLPGGEVRALPEYDDCRRVAREHGLPLRQIYELVLRLSNEKQTIEP